MSDSWCYSQAKIEAAELTINHKTQNLRRLEAQRNALNARGEYQTNVKSGLSELMCRLLYSLVRLLREELQLLQEPGSYVGEIVKVMGKNKVLVKVQPEGKYSMLLAASHNVAYILVNITFSPLQSSTLTAR